MTPYIRDLIKEHNFDFICFQETIQKDFKEKYLRTIDPFQSYLWHWVPAIGRSGGILTGVKVERFDVGSYKEKEYILQLKMWDKDLSFKSNLINVYSTAQEEHKENFLLELADFCSRCTEPYLIGGDFNLKRFSFEKNQNFHPNRNYDIFNKIIESNELREIDMAGGIFTWSNNQEKPTLVKLYRVLMTKEWEIKYPMVKVYKKTEEMSDHNPLIVTTICDTPSKNISFEFELSWLKSLDFLTQVARFW